MDEAESGVSPISRLSGDEAVTAATGRTPDAWFAALDEAGAAEWEHAEIARWLSNASTVTNWWAQNLSVRYEQARGKRLPGQQKDGTFSASRTSTIDGSLSDVTERMLSAFTAEHGDPVSSRRDGARPSGRWIVPTGGRVIVTAEVVREGRIRVAATHEKLADATAIIAAKEGLGRTLATLSS